MSKAIRSLARLLPLVTVLCLSSAGQAAPLSDDLYSFQILIGGEAIMLPCAYQQMRDAGWIYTGDEEESLRPEERTVSSAWEKNGVLLSGEMVNTSWDVLPVKECVLAAVALEGSHATVTLPGDIVLLASLPQDVLDAYGTPSSSYEDGRILQYTYRLDYDREAIFTFPADGGPLRSAHLRNVIMSLTPDPAALAGREAASSYRAPESLGEDPFSFHVSFGGALYALPAPVSEFIKNGWVPAEGANRPVRAYGSEQLTLSLNGQEWTTWVYNHSDHAALAVNCLVTTLVSNASRGDIPLALPGGISAGTAEADAVGAYQGLNAKKSETGAVIRYAFSKGRASIVLSIQRSTGLVNRIEVTNIP